jgi:hypothetical protein
MHGGKEPPTPALRSHSSPEVPRESLIPMFFRTHASIVLACSALLACSSSPNSPEAEGDESGGAHTTGGAAGSGASSAGTATTGGSSSGRGGMTTGGTTTAGGGSAGFATTGGAGSGGTTSLGGSAGFAAAGGTSGGSCESGGEEMPFEARCLACATTSCEQCLCSECTEELETCSTTPGCPEIAACVKDSGCTGVDCYCGTFDAVSCAAGQADGPCKSSIVDAPGGKVPTLLDPSAGPASDAAIAIAQCSQPGQPCATPCGSP